MNEYEPGTVAVATVRGVPNVRVMRCLWTWCSGEPVGVSKFHKDEQVTDIRPLIVLDLRDNDTALAVAQTLKDSRWFYGQEVGKQIEAQTRPPKPDEPTAGGSQVREADGTVWTRVEGQPDKPWVYGGSDAAYASLNVMEVVRP